MWRGLVFAAMVYAAGDPRLDGHRPRGLDRVLQEFHREFNHAISSGGSGLALFDSTRNLRLVNDALGRMNRMM